MAHQTHNRLINGACDRELLRLAKVYARGRLIDVGCGEKQYEELFKPFVAEHVGVDHPDTQHSGTKVDIFSSGYDIPVPEGSFDTVLFTSVLEHMEEPERALAECARVLKRGGHMIFLVPFIWHVHEAPRDFFRFTPIGMRYLLGRTGFEVADLEPVCGFWATFGQLFTYKLYSYPVFRRYRAVTDRLAVILQAGASLLDRADFDDKWSAIYAGAARRI